LEESKSVAARFAPEGINVKEAYQTFRANPTDSFNVFAGAPGTNRRLHCALFACIQPDRLKLTFGFD